MGAQMGGPGSRRGAALDAASSMKCCAACGAPLIRRMSEQKRKFTQRQTCGFTCGAKAGATTQSRRTAIPESKRPMCVICKTAPRAVDKLNRLYIHCGDPRCRDATLRGEHVIERDTSGWPKITGVVVLDFCPHEMSPPAELGRIGLPSGNVTSAGVVRYGA